MGKPSSKMSIAEYLARENEQPDRHEFYRGNTYPKGGGTKGHNRVVTNLARRIDAHLDGTACEVFARTVKVQLSDACFYPDMMVECGSAEKDDATTTKTPLLIVEVLSPSPDGYDRRAKFTAYRTLPSLREFALIDAVARTVEVFTVGEAGAWLLTDQTNHDHLTLASIDCELAMAFVFKGIAVSLR